MFSKALADESTASMAPKSVSMKDFVGFDSNKTNVNVSSFLDNIIDLAKDSTVIWGVAGFMILVGIVLYVLGKTFPNILMSGVKLIINVIIGIVLTIVGVQIAKIILGMFLQSPTVT